ncbi:MAG: isoprenylcysteine carboxylmethyltransferase family protein [Armatimonadetes bacterium]|nr:isoprenylcysteine carboxylmethyltransferase family protein [Armatimonadota bacterium]
MPGGWPVGVEERVTAIAGLVISFCVALVLLAVAVNFARAERSGEVAQRRRSPVATGTMLLFLLAFYLLLHHRVGVVPVQSLPLLLLLTVVGLTLVLVGTAVNLLGRLALGGNWANQVTVYRQQTLVTRGVFRLVRHPLYASLLWMFYGAALVYHNLAALLAVTLVFWPMMRLRAAQEEALLRQRFPEYAAYCRRVGRFWPRWRLGDTHEMPAD